MGIGRIICHLGLIPTYLILHHISQQRSLFFTTHSWNSENRYEITRESNEGKLQKAPTIAASKRDIKKKKEGARGYSVELYQHLKHKILNFSPMKKDHSLYEDQKYHKDHSYVFSFHELNLFSVLVQQESTRRCLTARISIHNSTYIICSDKLQLLHGTSSITGILNMKKTIQQTRFS